MDEWIWMSTDVYGWVNMDEYVWRMKGWSLTPNDYKSERRLQFKP